MYITENQIKQTLKRKFDILLQTAKKAAGRNYPERAVPYYEAACTLCSFVRQLAVDTDNPNLATVATDLWENKYSSRFDKIMFGG